MSTGECNLPFRISLSTNLNYYKRCKSGVERGGTGYSLNLSLIIWHDAKVNYFGMWHVC